MGALHLQTACLTALHISQPRTDAVNADLHSLPFTHCPMHSWWCQHQWRMMLSCSKEAELTQSCSLSAHLVSSQLIGQVQWEESSGLSCQGPRQGPEDSRGLGAVAMGAGRLQWTLDQHSLRREKLLQRTEHLLWQLCVGVIVNSYLWLN